MKRYSILVGCLIAVVFSSVNLYAQGFSGPGSQATLPVISGERALEIALNRAGGGTVIEMEWELKRWGSQYDVEIHRNGMKVEVKVDGANGNIISYKEKRASQRFVMPPPPPQNRITFERAREAALTGRNNAAVEEIEWKHRHGQWIYEISVRQDGRKQKIYLDASGRQIQRTWN